VRGSVCARIPKVWAHPRLAVMLEWLNVVPLNSWGRISYECLIVAVGRRDTSFKM